MIVPAFFLKKKIRLSQKLRVEARKYIFALKTRSEKHTEKIFVEADVKHKKCFITDEDVATVPV